MRWWTQRRRARQVLAKHEIEKLPVQLRILRAHTAAQAGEISNLRTQLGQLDDRIVALTSLIERHMIAADGRMATLIERVEAAR